MFRRLRVLQHDFAHAFLLFFSDVRKFNSSRLIESWQGAAVTITGAVAGIMLCEPSIGAPLFYI